MLNPIMSLQCDEPGCDKQARAAVSCWGTPPAAEIAAFILGCESAGWEVVPDGAGELGAHYCPWHNSRVYRRCEPAAHVRARARRSAS